MDLDELIQKLGDLIGAADTAADAGDVDAARGYLRQAKQLLEEEFLSE